VTQLLRRYYLKVSLPALQNVHFPRGQNSRVLNSNDTIWHRARGCSLLPRHFDDAAADDAKLCKRRSVLELHVNTRVGEGNIPVPDGCAAESDERLW
jgi:hypothetical protein